MSNYAYINVNRVRNCYDLLLAAIITVNERFNHHHGRMEIVRILNRVERQLNIILSDRAFRQLADLSRVPQPLLHFIRFSNLFTKNEQTHLMKLFNPFNQALMHTIETLYVNR